MERAFGLGLHPEAHWGWIGLPLLLSAKHTIHPLTKHCRSRSLASAGVGTSGLHCVAEGASEGVGRGRERKGEKEEWRIGRERGQGRERR